MEKNEFLKTKAFKYYYEYIPLWEATYDDTRHCYIYQNTTILFLKDVFDVLYNINTRKVESILNVFGIYNEPKYKVGDNVLVESPDSKMILVSKTILRIEYEKNGYSRRYLKKSDIGHEEKYKLKKELENIIDNDPIIIEYYDPCYIVDSCINPIRYNKHNIYLLSRE